MSTIDFNFIVNFKDFKVNCIASTYFISYANFIVESSRINWAAKPTFIFVVYMK